MTSAVIVLCAIVAVVLLVEGFYEALERQRARWEDEVAAAGRKRDDEGDPQ